MTFGQIKGNADLCRSLAGMIDSGKVPHAIMFHDDDGGAGVEIALAFLQYLYCRSRSREDSCSECPSCRKISKLIHPDVHFVYPTASGCTSVQFLEEFRSLVLENPRFTLSQFREALGLAEKPVMIAVSEANSLIRTLSLSSLEGGYSSVLVYLPELLNQEAANKLLKLVEEPPAMTQFVMVTHSPEKVLSTISSRCQRIRVLPDGSRAVRDAGPDGRYRTLATDLFQALLSRNLMDALETGDAIAALPDRESAKAFCVYVSEVLRDAFLLQQGLTGLSSGEELSSVIASRCPKNFPRRAVEVFDRANMLIGRNVNSKIIFTDLVDRLHSLLK